MLENTEDRVALYLLEYPEDEVGIGIQVEVEGAEGPQNVVTMPVFRRYSEWCYRNGFIDKAALNRSYAFARQVEQYMKRYRHE